jgi:hypothetical protein
MNMDPERMIVQMGKLTGDVNRFASQLRDEAEMIGEEWEGLGRAGGHRADHAAQLLGKLRPILLALRGYCELAEDQIDDMVADPFQRGKILKNVETMAEELKGKTRDELSRELGQLLTGE